MTIQFRPEPRRPFKAISDSLSQGIQQGFQRRQSSDILDQVIGNAMNQEGDLLSNLLSGLQGSGASVEEGLEAIQRFAPLISANNKSLADQRSILAENEELNRIQRGTAGSMPQDQSVPGQSAPSIGQPILEQIQQTGIGQRLQTEQEQVDPLDQFIDSNPRVKGTLNTIDRLQQDIEGFNSQIDQISANPRLSDKAKDRNLKILDSRIKDREEKLKNLRDVSQEDRKDLSEITKTARRARNLQPKIDRLEQLIPKISKGQPLTVAGRVVNPFKASDRARVKEGIFTPDEQEAQGIVFDVIRDQFETLPRIKTEFETILDRNISVLQTEEGNRRLVNNLRAANDLAIDREKTKNELLDRGVPASQVNSILDQAMEAREQSLIGQIRSDFSQDTGKLKNILFPRRGG